MTELTYVETEADGSIVLKELYPVYVDLLTVFFCGAILLSWITR